jgi:hypothetical protein
LEAPRRQRHRPDLELLDAPERLVDTTTDTGLCNEDPIS